MLYSVKIGLYLLLLLDGKKALVPLTSSVYVDAELVGTERVLVDIGTGYYIEQVSECARERASECC